MLGQQEPIGGGKYIFKGRLHHWPTLGCGLWLLVLMLASKSILVTAPAVTPAQGQGGLGWFNRQLFPSHLPWNKSDATSPVSKHNTKHKALTGNGDQWRREDVKTWRRTCVAMWLRHTDWLDSPGLKAGILGNEDLHFMIRAMETWSSKSEALYFMMLKSRVSAQNGRHSKLSVESSLSSPEHKTPALSLQSE